ncbi:carboxypeptidase M32 [Stieleria sp. JC731]|uniref:carboxypeptidase M32 n=1 Tax=Pirellulaceae TaxID=2691357 RepID=UPI001E3794A2|nr:carboxypeptidase M32 [Stieleria sp. JC731]MCC9602839.1 carboxypeptidase M32 [Stieleria sp. JC731]
MTIDDKIFQSVCQTARQAALFQSAADALEWDERTGMPVQGGSYRADQVSALRSTVHRLRTDPKYGESLDQLSEQCKDLAPASDNAATIRELKRDFKRDCKLPIDLVSRLSSVTVRGQQIWDRARKEDSFAMFKDILSEIVHLKREAGERMAEGSDRSAYEALLDEYEPDARISHLGPVFSELKTRLSALITELVDSPKQPDPCPLQQTFPIDGQRKLSRKVAEAVGFDFTSGRLDETSHPFCTTLGPNDCRILTRYESNWLPSGLYGTLHEAGHGLYEQGLRSDWFGLPPGSFVSLGMHESQSRLWENQVGRSRAFSHWLTPILKETFPELLSSLTAETLYAAVNVVRPSLIRVEADEATYNLHILIRFELEQSLIAGDLAVDDLPQAWNAQYAESLGIEPPSDANGVLQDVHWSAGLIGYFPTYTLGNLAAAQLFDSAAEHIGDVESLISKGEFEPILHWLREHVHHHGRCYTGSQLVENATGKPLSSEPLLNYLTQKLKPIYALS